MHAQVRFDVKVSWRILAMLACAALASGPSLAAGHRGKSARAGVAASHQAPAASHQDGSGAAPHSDPTATDNKTGSDTAPQNPAPSVFNSRTSKGPGETDNESGKGAKAGKAGAAHGIDLVTRDDGYANLHRRAVRSSLIAAGQKKKLQIGPPVAATPHPPSSGMPSPGGGTVEHTKTAVGAALPVSPVAKPDVLHPAPGGLTNSGPGKNSLGLSVNETQRPEIHVTATGIAAPVRGINGTTMGHVGVNGIGGPAKDRSPIGGSSYQHRF